MDPSVNVNNAAFSWYPKAGHLGLAMRTEKWRYVEWTKPDSPTIVELFNSVDDTQNNLNLAKNPEYAEVLKSLSKQMREKFPEKDLVESKSKNPKAAKNEAP
jgi:iduronate 2-sulfatase